MKGGEPLQRRTPMKRSGIKPKRNSTKDRDQNRRRGIKAESDRRKSQRAERRDVVGEVIERDGRCMARAVGAPGDCMGGLVAHEVVKRSQRRDAHLDTSNCIAVCAMHNGWIEDNPREARALGLVDTDRVDGVLPCGCDFRAHIYQGGCPRG